VGVVWNVPRGDEIDILRSRLLVDDNPRHCQFAHNTIYGTHNKYRHRRAWERCSLSRIPASMQNNVSGLGVSSQYEESPLSQYRRGTSSIAVSRLTERLS
jgi:hypothetical protein